MEKYAKVIVRSNTFHTDNLFTYKIPEFLENTLPSIEDIEKRLENDFL